MIIDCHVRMQMYYSLCRPACCRRAAGKNALFTAPISLQITWARLKDDQRPYSVLTVGDSNYVDDMRFTVLKPRKYQDVS